MIYAVRTVCRQRTALGRKKISHVVIHLRRSAATSDLGHPW